MVAQKKMAPHRSAVCDNMKQNSPTSGMQKTNLVVLSSKPEEKRAPSATHLRVPSLLSMHIGEPGNHKSVSSVPVEKYGADSYFLGVESEASRSSTPVTNMSTSFPSSTSSFPVPMQSRRGKNCPKGSISGQSDDESSKNESDNEYVYDKLHVK
jgi:hypothetical protein